MLTSSEIRAYFERIALPPQISLNPNAELLAAIHLRHCLTVPYENIDILNGIPLSLEEKALFDKIVVRRRGGYCYELNGLLSSLLVSLGYSVVSYAARYLRGENELPMRRHRVLRVTTSEGDDYLCDVGIGQASQRLPLLMKIDIKQEQFGEIYRLSKDPFLGWLLSDLHHGEYRPFYAFTEEPQIEADFIAPSFFCEKHPSSPFISADMIAIKTMTGRITLDGNKLRHFDGDNVTERDISASERLSVLKNEFGIEL